MDHRAAGRLGALASSEARAKINAERRLLAETRFVTLRKRCLHCGAPISFAKRFNKFCGHPCRATYWNTRRGSQARRQPCVVCGEPSKRSRHCSAACWQRTRWSAEKARLLMLGVAPKVMTAKRLLIDLHGRRCASCKKRTWMQQPIPVTLDHINGNPDDHSIANLRLLCPNCHAQTPSFTGRNRGNGRLARRLRDREDCKLREYDMNTPAP
jgi:predicted nucleic acid-binding Zn ribbon protein